jgi:hypothetical protein
MITIVETSSWSVELLGTRVNKGWQKHVGGVISLASLAPP